MACIKVKRLIYQIFFGLFLSVAVSAQSVSKIKFDVGNHPLTTDKNLVSVSTSIATKQAYVDGIHFKLIVENNSGKSIGSLNVANRLAVGLFNERGYDIAIRNNAGFSTPFINIDYSK
ncbi:hypothetical protein [Pedobacter sp. GR22-6]|uniref:hypothetical protein n=1 Tax=Pedobacter sp. GR22-6 TaxID=3127957 RepID=UPI00307D10D1